MDEPGDCWIKLIYIWIRKLNEWCGNKAICRKYGMPYEKKAKGNLWFWTVIFVIQTYWNVADIRVNELAALIITRFWGRQ